MRSMAAVVLALAVGATGFGVRPVSAQARPDFSGTWVFDQAKSSRSGANGKFVAAAMLGDECAVKQDVATLTLAIKFGGSLINAAYKLDGSESRNQSPGATGDVTVISHASWSGTTLVILSTSTQADGVTVETRRVLWIDTGGDLIVERTGTPASQVTASRSVYRKAH